MFDQVRVQIIHPCRARCAWCSTHRKNPRFQQMLDEGLDAVVHRLHEEVVERFDPREVFVSGGEPLLHPDIGRLLRAFAGERRTVHVFTSYQYARPVAAAFGELDLPPDRIVLNHTPIYFEPDRWHALTNGFPFATYLANVRDAVALPVRKRFKFIVNHAGFADEIRRFQDLVRPDDRCEVTLKVMNDQGDGLVAPVLHRTAERVHDRIDDLDAVLREAGWDRARSRTSVDLLRDVVVSGDVERCLYRREPKELRLSFYRVKDGVPVLKYRYCPYFPPDFGHRFHVGKDDPSKLARNYAKGPFRERCGDCRLLHYRPEAAGTTA